MSSRTKTTLTETLFEQTSWAVLWLFSKPASFAHLTSLSRIRIQGIHLTWPEENDRRWSRSSSMTIHVVVVETRASGNRECREDLAVGYPRHNAASVGQMRCKEQYETRTEDCDFVFVVRKICFVLINEKVRSVIHACGWSGKVVMFYNFFEFFISSSMLWRGYLEIAEKTAPEGKKGHLWVTRRKRNHIPDPRNCERQSIAKNALRNALWWKKKKSSSLSGFAKNVCQHRYRHRGVEKEEGEKA